MSADERELAAEGTESGEDAERRPSASRLPPPPYRAAPPASTPFVDAESVPDPTPAPSPAPAVERTPAPGPSSAPRARPVPPLPPRRAAPPATPPLPPPPQSASPRRAQDGRPPVPSRRAPAMQYDDDSTQLMTTLPPVPRVPHPMGGTDDVLERREGSPGSSGGILRAAGTMAIATLVSRVTGLIRTIVLVAALGVGLVNNAYTVANTLPNIVYELLLGGVLTSVIVPLLVHAQKRDKDGGTAYAQRLSTLAVLGLTGVTLLAILAAPLLTRLYNITGDPHQIALANWLARILLIEIVFYGIGALAQAILNSRDVFGPPAWAPVLNNVVVILTGVLFMAASGTGKLTPVTITPAQVWLLGIGTTLGIVVQAVVLLPSLSKAGVPLRPQWGLKNTGLREAGSLGLWVIGYVAVSQVGVLVATRIANAASYRPGGLGQGPSAFATVSLLFQMPYGIIGVALLTALLPRMSRAAAHGDVDGVIDDLSLGTRLSALGLLPVTCALVVLGPPLTILAFAHGHTSHADAATMGSALAIGAFGLLPMAVTLLQLRVFYSMKDARTPTLIQVGMVAVRVPLLLLVPAVVAPHDVVAGLMFVTSVTYVAGWVLGDIALRRRLGTLRTRETLFPLLRIAIVSVAAAAIGWVVTNVTDHLLGTSTAGSLGTVLIGTVVIGAAALAGLVVARVPELREPLAAVRARVGRG